MCPRCSLLQYPKSCTNVFEFVRPLSHLGVLPNISVLSSLSLSQKEEIYSTGNAGNLHPHFYSFRILLMRTFLSALVGYTWTDFFFYYPSDQLSLPANWDRALATVARIILFISLLLVLPLLFEITWSCLLNLPPLLWNLRHSISLSRCSLESVLNSP